MVSTATGSELSGSRARYLPFGGWRTEPTTPLTSRGFTGHPQNNLGSGDTDLGLIYMNARYYLPHIGRFLSRHSRENGNTLVPNPVNSQSYNRYSYVYNNPLLLVDPSGHFGFCFQQGMAAASDVTALSQMCTILASKGYFGASKSFKVFANDENGRKEALAWYRNEIAPHIASSEFQANEQVVIMGYSYGGAGALEFAWLLNDYGGQQYEGEDVPALSVTTLALIDPVFIARNFINHNIYELDENQKSTIPGNVLSAVNLYATMNHTFGLTPVDHGSEHISGAMNIAMNANHCTIGYETCNTPNTSSSSSTGSSQSSATCNSATCSNAYQSASNPPSSITLNVLTEWFGNAYYQIYR